MNEFKTEIFFKIFNRIIKRSQNSYVPQFLNFRCRMTHINSSFKKIGTTYGLQKKLNKEMDHGEVFIDTLMNERNECLDYVRNDILGTAVCSRYSKGLKKITVVGMKNSLTLLSLGRKYFSSLGDETDEPIYT